MANGNEIQADLLIIGFGKGGKTVAAEMGRRGRRVVLVERSERMYGGTCPNVGCIPSKGLVHHSGLRRPSDPPQEFYENAVREVQEVREGMRRQNIEDLEALETVTVLTGAARFVDSHTVLVELIATGEEVRVSGRHVLLNSGSEPVWPRIPGLEESERIVGSTALIESPRLPERLVILGGGYLGIEFAGIYQRFGSRVQMIEVGPRLLPQLDDDVSAAARAILEAEGVEILIGQTVTAARDDGESVTLVLGAEALELSADRVLVAAGRRPITRGLDLDAAGIETDERGAIMVDEHLRTSQPGVFALGDVNGGPQFTYVALDDSRIVLDQLLGEGRRTILDRRAVPQTLFITPPLATVGMSERDARAAGIEVRIGREDVADIVAMPRAYAVQETRGLMKFVVDARSEEILGAALLSIEAQEMINTVALAMRHGIKAAELRDAIYTHPSATEAMNEVLSEEILSPAPISPAAVG